MTQVRTHTRRQKNGRTVTVHRHDRDPAAAAATAQRKRDRFEGRVLREQQQAAHPEAYPNARTPGERRPRKRGPQPARAKRHAKKGLRLWRRHKVRAAFYFAAAASEAGAWVACRAIQKLRHRTKKGRR